MKNKKPVYYTGLINSMEEFYAPQHWHIPTDLTNALTLKEASLRYNYSRSAILMKIKKGKIYGCKIGSRWVVFPAGL